MKHLNKCRECIAIRLMPEYKKPKVCPLCGLIYGNIIINTKLESVVINFPNDGNAYIVKTGDTKPKFWKCK